MKLPTLAEQIDANLVTTITNVILDIYAKYQEQPIENAPVAYSRALPPGIYMRDSRHLYAVVMYMKNGKRTQKQIARGPLYDFSLETIAYLVAAIKAAKATL